MIKMASYQFSGRKDQLIINQQYWDNMNSQIEIVKTGLFLTTYIPA